MKKKEIKKSLFKSQNIIIALILVVVVSIMTIGFAAYDKLLSVEGQIKVVRAGTIEITNITLLENSNVLKENSTFDIRNSNFNINFGGDSDTYKAVYEVTLTNKSKLDYVYSGSDITKNITSSNLENGLVDITIEGIENGDLIQPDEVRVVKFTVTVNNTVAGSTYDVDITNIYNFVSDNSGNLLATLTDKTVDITGDKTAEVRIEVINTYSYDRDFYLSQNNTNLILNDNKNIKYTIQANTTKTYTFTIKAQDTAIFLKDLETVPINIKSNGILESNIGNLELKVDIYVEPDTEIPTVGNARLSILDTDGEFEATWDRIDTEGTSIVNYTLLLYNSLNDLVKEVNTNSSETFYKFSSIPEESYYIIVYGQDEAGNIGKDYVSSATTSNGYATRSETVKMRWVFTVTYNLSGMSTTGEYYAHLNQNYTTNFTENSGYTLPSNITVTMGGVTLTNGNAYIYSATNKNLVIYNVTGNIVITATADRNGCLVKGTKILLANNTYKNIENINYSDLLKVYSYEEGRFINTYPIWIEKTHISSKYQLTTFTDGTVLKTVGFHGVYDIENNKFISVDDKENFKVGTKVAMYKDNKLVETTVKKIEIINDKVEYYHVVSTRYYNIIANNLLTTDGTTILSNLYGFNNDITWTSLRKNVMQDKNNLYSYSEFSDIMPYYMFKGLRAEEAKVLSSYGLTKDLFKHYLLGNQLSSEMLKEPITKNKKRYWMVTTSEDNILNKDDYLREEGSYYEVNEPNNKENFVAWYNTGDGKYYNPSDKIQIWYGTYLEAIYK